MNADVERIRAEVERLHEEYRGEKGDADVRRALRTVLFFIDSMQEEPVSEDLEEAAKNVGKKYFPDESNIWARPNYEAKAAEYAFKDGANWQKEQMMKNAISMDVYYETEWDDIHKFLRKNLDGEKVKLTIIKED